MAGTDVNARNAKGQTPLAVTCTQGSPSLMQLLLAHPSVDKQARDNGRQTRALQSLTCPRLMLMQLIQSTDGILPLMLVSATGRDNFLDVLLNDKQIMSDINAVDKNGDTALHHAFQSNCFLV